MLKKIGDWVIDWREDNSTIRFSDPKTNVHMSYRVGIRPQSEDALYFKNVPPKVAKHVRCLSIRIQEKQYYDR